MNTPGLLELEAEARRRGLLLRLQVVRPLGLFWSLRIGVAERRSGGEPTAEAMSETSAQAQRPQGVGSGERLVLLGDLKAWALPSPDGLRIDSLEVAGREQGERDRGVGPLITAACFAWALEATPCRSARFLAIRDDARQHRRLVRYFQRLGFEPVRELGAAAWDLPARTVWGGAGLLMRGDCHEVLRRCGRRLELV
ncbi:hypothetical protein [Synechococcus sp. CBW1004]|uniref:hypothetical protein n=1 Tax=Synechococcus sp. CBW1004 TaxID=1353136 RepID=UPI0018CEE5D6|nr:hypothetical protein [Synechococcus sp. CBW1004]QPN64207.1 hypothetical protein H8F25_05315 [Synechococcus sp. CBW1004]